VVDADDDGRKDLLIGQSDGTIKVFLNVNTDENPQFDAGSVLQVGPPAGKSNIDVGARATSTVLDWNNDGRRDLVVGALDGKVRVYVNEGSNSSPDYRTVQFVQDGGSDLVASTQRSSPHVLDLDDDGKKDLLLGNTEGQLFVYSNVGSDAAPAFSGYTVVEADGTPINLSGYARSRPYVCDWNDDGVPDVLVGGSDGRVHLYPGVGVSTAVRDDETPTPAGNVILLSAYPNPFNLTTTIEYYVRQTQHVRLDVYDVAGRLVARLVDDVQNGGYQTVGWDGRGSDGETISSGVFFYRLVAGNHRVTKKMTLLR
jgi:hypothetical protein